LPQLLTTDTSGKKRLEGAKPGSQRQEFNQPAVTDAAWCARVLMAFLPLDNIDRNLVASLQVNARESVSELARQLGIARTTVIARLARLEKTGVIAGYGVRLGQDVLDASIQAYVGIKLAPKYGRDVQKRFARMPEMQLLCAVSGEFDYVAWLRADSPDRLNDLLDEIGGLEGVERTTTSIILARKVDRGGMG
jgi:DNA-binding Lrp family transcriptional regulator